MFYKNKIYIDIIHFNVAKYPPLGMLRQPRIRKPDFLCKNKCDTLEEYKKGFRHSATTSTEYITCEDCLNLLPLWEIQENLKD